MIPSFPPAETTPNIFISYSHADQTIRKKLETALKALLIDRHADLNIWSDLQIAAGSDWQAELEQAISEASVAILLITSNFLASDFIQNSELPRLLERRQKEGLILFPILAKACPWEAVGWLSRIQLIPRDNKAVWRSGGRYVDEELTAIVLEVRTALMQPAKLPEARKLVDEARSMYSQIAKDAAAQQAERQKISGDLLQHIFEITSDVKIPGAKTAKKVVNAMDAYIRE